MSLILLACWRVSLIAFVCVCVCVVLFPCLLSCFSLPPPHPIPSTLLCLFSWRIFILSVSVYVRHDDNFIVVLGKVSHRQQCRKKVEEEKRKKHFFKQPTNQYARIVFSPVEALDVFLNSHETVQHVNIFSRECVHHKTVQHVTTADFSLSLEYPRVNLR